MAYADYNFYATEYKGRVVPESVFDSVSERASEVLDAITFDRISEVSDLVKKACCAICDSVYNLELRGGAAIESEQVGSHRITYRGAGAGWYGAEHHGAAATYLSGTGLLYRGCYLDE